MYEIEENMPYTELLKWIEFFNTRPVGWREDQRTYLVLRSLGYKGSPESLFATLKKIKSNQIESQKPDRAIPKGVFLDKLLRAKNGDGSNFKLE